MPFHTQITACGQATTVIQRPEACLDLQCAAGKKATPVLTRRRFLAAAASVFAASSFPLTAGSQDQGSELITGTLAVDPNVILATVPHDFTGLSYESAQLANPEFFSANNQTLVRLFRELSQSGILRLGGGTSEYTTFSKLQPSAEPPFETFGPDTSKTVKPGTTTSALALRNLRTFLDATNWSCLYGLNLAQGTKENAAAEADAVCHILGPRLLALQIGNEPDSFKRFRPQGYTPEDYIREWLEFHDAIVARVPEARFAGPDISNKLPYLTAFAAEAAKHPDIRLLTIHYYAMGPAGNPLATMDNLLSPDPRLTTLKWQNVEVVQNAMRSTHLPCRISEANSCWNGGLEGVSDSFGSALWCADMMLHFASLGMAGVNLHGGGDGWYSPIVGSSSNGLKRRPEFFGIQFAQRFAGAALLRTEFKCSNDRVSAWAARVQNQGRSNHLIALINKTNLTADIQLGGTLALQRWYAMNLTASSLNAKTGVRFEEMHLARTPRNILRVEPHSALLLQSNQPVSDVKA